MAYYGAHYGQQQPQQATHEGRDAQWSESTASLFSSAPDQQQRTQQRYIDPYAQTYSNGRSNSGPSYPSMMQQQREQQQPNTASTSMADLGRSSSNIKQEPYNTYGTAATSMTELAQIEDGSGRPSKKQPKVYQTAFGPFSWRDLLKRKFWKYYAGLAILSVAVALAVIFHDDIIKWFQPIAEKIRDIPAGWLIWVGIMFVISFPPLFGQEVVCLLCGLIYGLWIGFGIISLGTMLGEWGNFIVFKWGCTARSKKLEEKDVTYACICKVIRDGGFRIAFMARLSAIPGHLTTPAFAACGMSLWVFTITAIITLPKQLMAVYLGTVFGQDNKGEITTSKIVEWIILGLSFIITIWAAWYIYKKMAYWRPIVLQEQAERQAAAAAQVNGEIPSLQTSVHATTNQPVSEGGPGIIVTSPSMRTNHRTSGAQWPNSERNEHVRSDRMREVDLEDARSPLVQDAYDPAGHQSSTGGYGMVRRQSDGFTGQQHQQNGLYPVQTIQTYGSQSQEEISFGYADGGEAFTQRLPSPYDENGHPRPQGASRSPSPRHSEQYMPSGSSNLPGQRQRRSSYTQPDVPLQETRRQNPHRVLTPEGAPQSEQAEELEMRSQPSQDSRQQQQQQRRSSRDRRDSQSRYPQQPQQQQQYADDRQARRGSRSSQPPSRYPGMYAQPQPVSQTHYHSRPPPANGSLYHRDASSPAPTYHTQHPVHRTLNDDPHSQSWQDQQQQQDHMQFPPREAPPRYQNQYRQQQ